MEWRAPGILLANRRHGESAAIIDVFTEEHGRHAGLVRGGASRRLAPILQPGAQLDLTWRARLSEHLGSFTVEPLHGRTGLLSDRLGLAGLSAVTALTVFALAERQAYPALYRETEALLDRIESQPDWPAYYVGWEVALLATLGFGLQLDSCAVTGVQDGLVGVSPRSGRAVAQGGRGADHRLGSAGRAAADRPFPVDMVGAGARQGVAAAGARAAGARLRAAVIRRRDRPGRTGSRPRRSTAATGSRAPRRNPST